VRGQPADIEFYYYYNLFTAEQQYNYNQPIGYWKEGGKNHRLSTDLLTDTFI
jgi:hypothetical protein